MSRVGNAVARVRGFVQDLRQDPDTTVVGPHSWGIHADTDAVFRDLHRYMPPGDGQRVDDYLADVREELEAREERLDTFPDADQDYPERWRDWPGYLRNGGARRLYEAAKIQADETLYLAVGRGPLVAGGVGGLAAAMHAGDPLVKLYTGSIGALSLLGAPIGIRTHWNEVSRYMEEDVVEQQRDVYREALDELEQQGEDVLLDRLDEKVATPPIGATHIEFYRDDDTYRHGHPGRP